MSHFLNPFVLHTFIETRDTEPYRVFHTMGHDDAWVPKRLFYGKLIDSASDHPRPHTTDRQPSLNNAVLRTDCWPDRFLIFADPDALTNEDQVDPNAVWYTLPSPNGARWIPLSPDEINIVNFNQVPADHRQTERYTVSGDINGHSKPDIIADISATHQMPEFLLHYYQEDRSYRVDINVPKANTVRYNLLRDVHLSEHWNPTGPPPTRAAHQMVRR